MFWLFNIWLKPFFFNVRFSTLLMEDVVKTPYIFALNKGQFALQAGVIHCDTYIKIHTGNLCSSMSSNHTCRVCNTWSIL